MNMTAKSNSSFDKDTDSFGDRVDIGDIIAYASGGTLCVAQVLGFTPMGIYISTHYTGKYNIINAPFDQHNSKRYLRWLSFKVIEKQKAISDELKPFCYFHQIDKKWNCITE